MPFTLDDYYPADSVEAQSWLYVQKFTHTHHVTWKHVAYAARYDALLSFFRSHSTLRIPRSPTAVSNEEDDTEHDARTRSDSAYSTSSLLSASSHASSSSSPSPSSRISSLPIIDPQSIPSTCSPSSSSSSLSKSMTTSSPNADCREKLYTTPDSSNIIYIPPRTLADLADVLARLAMSYMLTHISYLRESLKGSDFSTMKSIALGGLRALMQKESTRSTSFIGSILPPSPMSSPAGGEQERRNVGQDWLRLFDGRDEWDGKTPTLDLRQSPPALSRPHQLPISNPYPRNEVHRGGLKA